MQGEVMADRRGITLIEVLVSIGLLSIFMTICTLMFTSSSRRLQVTCLENNVQSSCCMGIDRLCRDIEETEKSHIVAQNTPDGKKYLFFSSTRDELGRYRKTTGGTPQWYSWIVYYLYPYTGPEARIYKGKALSYLARKQVYSLPLDPVPSLSIFVLPADTEKSRSWIVAHGVLDFESIIAPHSVSVRLRTAGTYRGQWNTFEVEKTVFIKDFD
jgi:prepilin-type N-terminal cleavage/methylation domain-containing protein